MSNEDATYIIAYYADGDLEGEPDALSAVYSSSVSEDTELSKLALYYRGTVVDYKKYVKVIQVLPGGEYNGDA